jgi:galactose-1-phosphate uridylyltransferase
MCDNCYHTQGRKKKAWECEHTTKHHYAKGLCQACYQNEYSTVKIKSNFRKRLWMKNKYVYELISFSDILIIILISLV